MIEFGRWSADAALFGMLVACAFYAAVQSVRTFVAELREPLAGASSHYLMYAGLLGIAVFCGSLALRLR